MSYLQKIKNSELSLRLEEIATALITRWLNAARQDYPHLASAVFNELAVQQELLDCLNSARISLAQHDVS